MNNGLHYGYHRLAESVMKKNVHAFSLHLAILLLFFSICLPVGSAGNEAGKIVDCQEFAYVEFSSTFDVLNILRKKERSKVNDNGGANKVERGPEGRQGPSGPPGPQGPQGPQGPAGHAGESFHFPMDPDAELTFCISLFQVGSPQFESIQVIPCVISPSGIVAHGSPVLINMTKVKPYSFVDIFSPEYGGKPITISSPEFGLYQVGVMIVTQSPQGASQIFNLNLGAQVTAGRKDVQKTTSTEIVPSGFQTVLRYPSTELQLWASFVYGFMNQAPLP